MGSVCTVSVWYQWWMMQYFEKGFEFPGVALIERVVHKILYDYAFRDTMLVFIFTLRSLMDSLVASNRSVLWCMGIMILTCCIVSQQQCSEKRTDEEEQKCFTIESDAMIAFMVVEGKIRPKQVSSIAGVLLENARRFRSDAEYMSLKEMNMLDRVGRTQLITAARGGRWGHVRALLELRADPSIRDSEGLRAVDQVCANWPSMESSPDFQKKKVLLENSIRDSLGNKSE